MRSRLFLLVPFLMLAACIGRKAPPTQADDNKSGQPGNTPSQPAPDTFAADVQPFVKQHCLNCHNAKKEAGGLNLATYTKTAEVIRDRETWETVKQRLELHEMPPKNEPRPNDGDVKKVVAWINTELERAAKLAPRSPGRVTLRRLNRTEYDHTIRDLIGLDLHAADDFPTDDVGYGF